MVLHGPAEGQPEFLIGSVDVVSANVPVSLEVVLQCDDGIVCMVTSLVMVFLMLVVSVGFFCC